MSVVDAITLRVRISGLECLQNTPEQLRTLVQLRALEALEESQQAGHQAKAAEVQRGTAVDLGLEGQGGGVK